MVGQQRVRRGVRLVEAVARKFLHQVEHLVGLGLVDVVLRGAVAEDLPVLGHLVRVLLAHGAAQHVGAAQRVAAQNLRGLHHLLLVDHDAVGLGQHLRHHGVGVFNFFAPVLARHKAGDQVHGARAVQGVQGDQVFQPGGPRVFQHALHAAAFKLEHGLGAAVGEQLVGCGVVQGDVLERKPLLPLVPGADEVLGDLQDGQRGQAQKVELHQADGLHVVLVELAHGGFAARLLVQRAEVRELARGDQHAAGVHADVARHAFELAREFQQRLHIVLGRFARGQLGLGLDRVHELVILLAVRRWQLQRDGDAGLVRDQLADAVTKAIAHVEHAAHVAHGGARGHGAEGDDLAHGLLAVLELDIVDHAVPVALAEVDVEVGHGHTLGVQEALEQQVVFERIQVRDLHAIGHQRARTRAATRSHRAAVVLGPVDEVTDDQEVARKAHLQDRVELELEAFHVARSLLLAFHRVPVQVLQPLLQSLERDVAEVLVRRHANAVHFGRRVDGQLRLAQHQREVAAQRDLARVLQRRGQVGEQLQHLRR